MRGFACIGLVNPKFDGNVGGVMRALGCYGGDLLIVSGSRFRREATDTQKAWRHVPVIQGIADVFDVIPYDCVPVAVDLVPDAVPLPDYRHPERAIYIFGAEDGTLGGTTLSRCRDRVMVPTRHCMNLAATVNVILYDRLSKGRR